MIGLAASMVALGLAGAAPAVAGPAGVEAGRAQIYRDRWGVPHIYAARETDGYRALGYAMAQDRPVPLMASIRRARGELAATFGADEIPAELRGLAAGVDDLVALDHQVRLWRLPAAARRAERRLDPRVRRNYRAFIAGVEAYFRAHPARRPAWAPRRLQVADLVAMAHSDVWMSYWAEIGLDDCKRGGAPVAPPARAPVPGASNGWALMPARTRTGGAILLSDPHGPIDGRFVYEYRLRSPTLDSAGFAQGPLLLIARNRHLGWAFTTGAPDVADCYVIDRAGLRGSSFRYDGARRSVERFPIRIGIKGRPPLALEGQAVRDGGIAAPVVAADDKRLWVVRTPYIAHLEGLHNAAYRMNLAANVDAFAAALDVPGTPIQNIVAADARGDIYYVHLGTVPKRPDPARDWTRPVPGNSAATAWAGLHPLRDLVSIRSPGEGFVQNNNVDPRFMYRAVPDTVRGKPDYLLTEGWLPTDRPTDRAVRFLEAIEARPPLSADDALALAMDAGVLHLGPWLALARAAGPAGDFLADLLRFDGQLIAESAPALKYVYWRRALRRHLTPALAAELAGVVERSAAPSPALLAAARAGLGDAAADLAAAPGGLARRYGDEFRLAAGPVTVPMSGGRLGRQPGVDDAPPVECRAAPLLCPTTLLATGYGPGPTPHEWVATTGSRMMRLDLHGPGGLRSFTLQNPGSSVDPASPNSHDQARELLGQRRLKPVLFEWHELAPWVTSTTIVGNRRR